LDESANRQVFRISTRQSFRIPQTRFSGPPQDLDGRDLRVRLQQQLDALDHRAIGFGRTALAAGRADLAAGEFGEVRHRLGENSLHRSQTYAASNSDFGLQNASF
jgi:hypothetical protein